MKRLLLVVAAISAPAFAQTDGSGTVTAGGTSQAVFQANVNRSYLECQNPTAATEVLFVSTNGPASTAGGSYELAAGGSIRFAMPAYVPNDIVSVTAATTGHRFVCKQR